MLPIGPLAIASGLAERGHDVRCFDYSFDNAIPTEIDAAGYDGVLIAVHTLRNIPTARNIMAVLKGASYIVAGGNVCSEIGVPVFRQADVHLDAVVRGYGHGVLEQIERQKKGDIAVGQVPNRMPVPDPSHLAESTLARYLQQSRARYPIVGPGGFGCAWSCNYCTAKMLSRHVERALSDIEKEVELASKLGYRELWCVDNLVLVDPDLALEFDQIVHNAGLTWLGMTRAETVRVARDRLSRFRSLSNIALGVEATTRMLTSLNRNARIDNDEVLGRAFSMLHDSGIGSTAFVMLDLPGSIESDYWELVDLLARIKPGNVSWSFYNPPAAHAIANGCDLTTTGFYRWPLGFAEISEQRVVQHAMLITGTWWLNWAPRDFFENDNEFGVGFDQGEIVQGLEVRSELGDLYTAWEYRSAVEPSVRPPHVGQVVEYGQVH
jgi:radical SAM superfamily enzyme YgiQ (UPF0313 family)